MKTRLVFIPGLGADIRLFRPQQIKFKNSISPTWIFPLAHEGLASYANRWAEILKIKPGCCLVGASFGGMLALEMARRVKAKSVVLIGSCLSPTSIPFPLRSIGSIPKWPRVGKTLTKIFPAGSGWFLGGQTKEQSKLLNEMFLQTPNYFLEWLLKTIQRWEGFSDKSLSIHQIHGDMDHLISVQNVRPDQVIKGGGHVLNLTHSEAVNEFIKKYSGK